MNETGQARRRVMRAATTGRLERDEEGCWWGVDVTTGAGELWMAWTCCPDRRYALAAEVADELLTAGVLLTNPGTRAVRVAS